MKRFINGDCIQVLSNNRFEADVIITDPPYNIGWDYSDKVNDKKKNYNEWCSEWAELCFKNLSPSGVLCIINYPENNNVLFCELIKKGYFFVQQLIWNYPTNIGHSKRKYTRSYRTILVFAKNEYYYFDPIKQEYKNPKDKRILERIAMGNLGVNHYDVLTFNLCKNVSKDKKRNGINQLPSGLVDFLINTFSQKGDLILDPFVGNGTVCDRAEILERESIGIDINDYENR